MTASVGWQACTVAAVAIMAGIPLGLLSGRLAWRLTAEALGVASGPAVPWPLLGAVVVGTVVLVNVAAAGPGWQARRVRPALALRAE